ncbi:hypothetical protein BXZ70DRAFT_134019 [Cristinia sonorae]|uniref:Uncharacterized protein n=1 Tax=Cristinia sonorae TaxID=1940300 RepID=A0A8K0UNG1_9AGAR|nr:hypothetical protein BXZ70DRAFT_134019 [Cristinia sonorae]
MVYIPHVCAVKDIGLTISVCGSAAVTEANRNLTVLFTVDNLKPEKFVMGNIRIGNCFYHSPAVDAKRSHVLTVNITNVSYSRGSFGFDYASVNPVALPKSSHRVRTIVGIVVGVAAFLILCLGVFWLWRRKSKRKAYVASRAKDLEHRMAVLAVRKSTLPVAPTPSATGPIDTKVDPFADPVPDQKQAS